MRWTRTRTTAPQEAAVKNVIEHEYVGDYRTAWDSLHPRHQRFVTREEYEECRRGIDVVGTIESVLILDVRDEPLTVYGLRPRTPSKEVDVRVTTDERVRRLVPRRPSR